MKWKALAPGLSVVLASLIWSFDSTVRERTFGGSGPRTVAFLEHLMAFIFVAPLIFQSRFERVMPRTRVEWGAILLISLGGSALAGVLYASGLGSLGTSLASTLILVQPILVLLFAWLFLKERSSSVFYLAAAWVVINAILLSLLQGSSFPEEGFASGSLYVIAAAILWSASVVAGKWLLRSFAPLVLLVWRFGFASTVLFLSLVLFPEPISLTTFLTDQNLAAALFLGIVVNAIGFLFYYRGLRALPVRVVTFIELLYPLFGVFMPVWTEGGQRVPLLPALGSLTLLVSIGFLLFMEYPREPSSET